MWIAACVLATAACRPPPPGPLDDLPSLDGLVPDPARSPAGVSQTPDEVGLAQILVNYKGSYQPSRRPRFDHRQALERAERLVALARSKGQQFDELARRFSDDADTSQAGGRLGVFSHSELHPDLERAAFALGLGQVSDPISIPRGYAILMRIEPFEAQAAEIVVTYTGARHYTPRVARSREQAAELAHQIRERLRAGGSFSQEAFSYSDQPNWRMGGFLPILDKNKLKGKKINKRLEKLEEIIWNLPEGQLSEVIESPTGFHIVGRWPVHRIRIRKMTFPYLAEGVEQPAVPVPSRQEALAQAETFARLAHRPGADFVDAAARVKGTDQEYGQRSGWLDRSALPHPVGERAFALSIGQVSDVIQIEAGFVVIKRVP